jgi:hypothetical protein
MEEVIEAIHQVKRIMPLLQEVQNQASLQTQQQADSLRYFNELNSVRLLLEPLGGLLSTEF